MSEVGYYRLKLSDLPVGSRTISFYKNGSLSGSKTITIKPSCEDQKILKYIDSKGQFRFFPFNKYYDVSDKPKLIGKANKIITSILTSQSDSSNIGYRNERTISLVADDVSQEELVILSDIYTSPRVFLFVGSGDSVSDWIEVTIKAKDNQYKWRKNKFGAVKIDVELPEWYSIKML
jgi:hypothetical protein